MLTGARRWRLIERGARACIHDVLAALKRSHAPRSAPAAITDNEIGLVASSKGRMFLSQSPPFRRAKCSKSAANPTNARTPSDIPAAVYTPRLVMWPNVYAQPEQAMLANVRYWSEKLADPLLHDPWPGLNFPVCPLDPGRNSGLPIGRDLHQSLKDPFGFDELPKLKMCLRQVPMAVWMLGSAS
jgi:hypothetical protein